MNFVMTIHLEGAMTEAGDVVRAIRSSFFEDAGFLGGLRRGDSGTIHDTDGLHVGKWEVLDPSVPSKKDGLESEALSR